MSNIGTPISAQEVLDEYWDGSLPVNPISIAQALGIAVYKNPNLTMSGMLAERKGGPAIIYNSNEATTRQRFTIAHEIGHYALGHGLSFRDGTNEFNLHNYEVPEVEANRFAAELLMPGDVVERYALKRRQTLASLAKLFDVSRVAMKIRLQTLGLIF